MNTVYFIIKICFARFDGQMSGRLQLDSLIYQPAGGTMLQLQHIVKVANNCTINLFFFTPQQNKIITNPSIYGDTPCICISRAHIPQNHYIISFQQWPNVACRSRHTRLTYQPRMQQSTLD